MKYRNVKVWGLSSLTAISGFHRHSLCFVCAVYSKNVWCVVSELLCVCNSIYRNCKLILQHYLLLETVRFNFTCNCDGLVIQVHTVNAKRRRQRHGSPGNSQDCQHSSEKLLSSQNINHNAMWWRGQCLICGAVKVHHRICIRIDLVIGIFFIYFNCCSFFR